MTNAPCTSLHPGAAIESRRPADFLARLSAVATAVAETVIVWQERAEQRAKLASLSDRMLHDMGLSRADVARESGLPFWRAR